MAKKKRGRPKQAVAVRRDYPVLRVRIEPELKALYDALAEDTGVSLRVLLRQLVDEHLDGADERTRRRVRRKTRERMK
ncbi:MAG: hypothetical protein AAF533_21050 [Acidobacteriota bacterium]